MNDKQENKTTERYIFEDEHGKAKILRGVVVYTGSSVLTELAIRIGFDTVWFDMEHSPNCFNDAQNFCYAAEAAGGIPSVRVPSDQRSYILRALEIGAQIIIVPMVNSAEEAGNIVKHGKFLPEGFRGYNTRSRAVGFGLTKTQTAFEQANRRTHLFVQIETCQALDNFDEILNVKGLSGIIIGPGDLSASLGCPGDLNNDKMIEIVTKCIRSARLIGKNAGILVSPGRLLDAAVNAGCNLVFMGGDIADLSKAWVQLLNHS